MLCALHHQQDQVPVLLVAAEEAEEWRRLVDQWIANEHRRGFGEADKAAMVEQLTMFGLSPDDISDQLKTDVAVVKAALTVRGSEKSTKLARQHDQLDMLQLAAISEFEDDEAAYNEIVDTLHNRPAQLKHVMTRRRHEREARQACDEEIRRLSATGVTAMHDADLPETAQPLSALTNANGQRLSELVAEHESCPGHAAGVRTVYSGDTRVSWHCLDWKKHGHQPHSDAAGRGQGLSEEDKAERKRARELNPQWRAAQEVRREWLQEFLQRTTPPKQTRQFLAAVLAAGDERVTKAIGRGNRYARTTLGDKRVDRLQAGGRRMTEDQVTMAELGIVLCAYEEAYDAGHTVNTWRSPTPADERYLTALATWGYPLSEVEQLALNPHTTTTSDDNA